MAGLHFCENPPSDWNLCSTQGCSLGVACVPGLCILGIPGPASAELAAITLADHALVYIWPGVQVLIA